MDNPAAVKILIVDDSRDSRLVLSRQLAGIGYDVFEAEDGVAALSAARRQRPNIVISDILMPNMDGFDLCRMIKTDPMLRDTRFIFYSANYLSPEDERLALDMGATQYLRKPAEPEDLVGVIELLLREQRDGAQATGGSHSVTDQDELGLRHRMRLTNKVYEQHDRNQLILETMVDGFLLTDAEGKILQSNPSYRRTSGYEAAELAGMHLSQLESPQDAGKVSRLFEIARTRGLHRARVEHVRKDGQIVDVELSLNLLPFDGAESRVAIFVRDVSLPRQLRVERRRLRQVLEVSLNEIYMFDQKSLKFMYVNAAALHNLGYSREEMAQMTPLDIKPDLSAGTFARLREPLDNDTQGKRIFETRHLRRDGSFYPVEVHLQLVREYEATFYLAMILDISERKDSEQAIHRLSRDMLQAEERERRRIARELHDSTAQDLVATLLNLESWRRTNAVAGNADVTEIDNSLELLERAANDLRTLSYSLYPPLLSDHGLVSAMEQYVAGYSQRANIAIRINADEIEEILGETVEITLFRVLQESLNNVRRHSGASQVTVRLANRERKLRLSVHDDGHGFDPQTVHAGNGDKMSGGVGIPAMQERLSHVGGKLDIQSDSSGTTVTAEIRYEEESL